MSELSESGNVLSYFIAAESETDQPATDESDDSFASCNDWESLETNDTFIDGARRWTESAPGCGFSREAFHCNELEQIAVKKQGAEVGSERATGAETRAKNHRTKKVKRWRKHLRNIWATITCRKTNVDE